MSLGFHRDSFTMLSELAEREEQKRLSFRTAATEAADEAASDSGSSFFTAATTGGSDGEDERWVDGIAVVTSPPTVPIPTPPDLGAPQSSANAADNEDDDDHTPLPERPTTGFDYEGFEGYADYHYDPYSISSSRASAGGGGKREGGNVFCCLFAPWMRKNRGTSFDDSSDEGESDSDSDHDHDEEDHAAVVAAASAEEDHEVGEHIVDTLAGDVTIFDAVDTSPSLEEGEKERATVAAVEERAAPGKRPDGTPRQIQEEEKARPRGDENSGDASGGVGPGEKGEPKSTTPGDDSPSTPPRSDKDSGDNSSTTPPQGSHAKRDSASMRQEILDETMRKVKEQHSPVERKLGILPPGGSPPTGVPFMLPSRLRESPARGIIKRQRLSSTSSSTDGKERGGGTGARTSSSGAGANAAAASSSNAVDNRPKRRSLFPTASADGDGGAGGVDAAHPSSLRRTHSARTRRKGVRFAPIAKVTTIVSRQDMNHIDRSRIWWSRSDYDAFKKTGRIVAKALLTGGSEIWLHSQNRRLGGGADFNSGKDGRSKDGDEEEDYGDKWWCRFGHSRRGLEHIASAEEGRLRQKSVANAHRAVLMEQRKQQLMAQRRGVGGVDGVGGDHVTGVVDEKKLAVVCQQHTSWAKQLALSTGRADAEAVKMNFAEGAGRTESLVVRASLARGVVYESSLTKRSSWENQTPLSPDLLDANTSSAIFVRKIDQREHDKQEAAKRAQCASPAPSSASASSASSKSTTKPDVPDVESASEAASDSSGESGAGAGRTGHELLTDKDGGLYEMVHDPEEHESNISKEAASFGKGDDGVDLQSFLSRSVGVGAH